MNGILSEWWLAALPCLLVSIVGVASTHAEDKLPPPESVVAGRTGEQADEKRAAVQSTSRPTQDGYFHWVSASTTSDNDGRSDSKTHVVRIQRQGDADAQKQGWLGVAISTTVSGAGDDNGVVMVSGVVKGSPADKAGLLSGDVIVSVDGEALAGGVADAVNRIKAHQAGDEVTIGVQRDGEEQTLTATLGSHAASDPATTIEMKLGTEPGGEVEDTIVTRGHMLRRDDDGNWVVTSLGDLDDLDDLPAQVKMFLPRSGKRVITVDRQGDSRSVHIEIKGDESLSIEQEDGGDITVTRVDEDGNKTVKVYADDDELKADDEEAFLILSGTGTGPFHFFDRDDDSHAEDFDFDLGDNKFFFSFDDKDFDAAAQEWHKHMEDSLAEANASAEEALQNARELMEKLQAGQSVPAFAKLHKLRPLIGDEDAQTLRLKLDKPRHSFKVLADGTIEVTIRKGDTEVVQLFSDADDLANRKPKLFDKYRDLIDAD